MNRASESEILLARIESDLRRPWSHLAFSADLERLYRDTIEPTRIKHFTIILSITLVMSNLFLVPERMLMPDAFGLAKLFQWEIVTPSTLFILWLLRRKAISAAATAMFFLSIVVIMVLTITMNSRDPHSVLMVFCIPMLLIFGSGLPLPFRWALALGCVASVGTCAAMVLHPCFDNATRMLAFAMLTSLLVIALLATYRFETIERRSYLLSLAETTRTQILAERNRILREMSNSDGLTGIGNRRLFDATLERLWIEHAETKASLALLMMDVDHFKHLNDIHGHLGGDLCLRGVADVLNGFARTDIDFVFRFGGDEFAVLLSGSDGQETARLAEHSRATIEKISTVADKGGDAIKVTTSIGHACAVPVLGVNPATLIAAADQALYVAKQRGRNCIHPSPFWAVAPVIKNTAFKGSRSTSPRSA